MIINMDFPMGTVIRSMRGTPCSDDLGESAVSPCVLRGNLGCTHSLSLGFWRILHILTSTPMPRLA